jgi:hypothetical protein
VLRLLTVLCIAAPGCSFGWLYTVPDANPVYSVDGRLDVRLLVDGRMLNGRASLHVDVINYGRDDLLVAPRSIEVHTSGGKALQTTIDPRGCQGKMWNSYVVVPQGGPCRISLEVNTFANAKFEGERMILLVQGIARGREHIPFAIPIQKPRS